MSNCQHGIGNLTRLPNIRKRGPTQHGIVIWKGFRMCTQEVKLSTWDRQFRKTSECAHKNSNSQHGIANLARLPNMHTRCPNLHTGKAIWQDFRI
ncbi:hypothetical protein PoB_002417100 [Plakobranchus ocellatus]|uniref:Uncharacterized protein n=1 Tax=Plakobranchus ocellatus TaxID=259542 RepID=A0AAV3ZNZ9_9GAST|nr:hypothetical protein PoB_002417100 [Plakobranchus ocellatus]